MGFSEILLVGYSQLSFDDRPLFRPLVFIFLRFIYTLYIYYVFPVFYIPFIFSDFLYFNNQINFPEK